MASLRLQLKHATELAEQQNGGVLVITEGVFGMKGDLGKLDEIVAMKKDFNFRLLVDDAHGFGTMGPHGRGTAAHFGVVDGVDVLFNTFAKSMAGIGAFVCGPRWLINLLRYNMRSQLYAKSLPMPMVIGALKRLDLIRKHPEYQEKLWEITRALQGGLKENGFEIGVTQSPVTPVYMKGGIPEATNLIVDLREKHNLFCSVVVYPVIPKGEIILRLIPTAAHTLDDVKFTIEAFKAIRDKLESGFYRDKPVPMKPMKDFRCAKPTCPIKIPAVKTAGIFHEYEYLPDKSASPLVLEGQAIGVSIDDDRMLAIDIARQIRFDRSFTT